MHKFNCQKWNKLAQSKRDNLPYDLVAKCPRNNVWALCCSKCPRKKCLGILLYSKYTDIIGTWGLSYKASVSILDTAKCVTACLLMIQGPAASALTLIMKYLKAKEELLNLKYFTIAKIY
jgi:hypothetical protein